MIPLPASLKILLRQKSWSTATYLNIYITIMTDIALKLATWALKKLGDYASDKIKPPVKEHLGLEADDALLKQIQQELQELQRGQVIVQEKVKIPLSSLCSTES
jgi:hypothetical protein